MIIEIANFGKPEPTLNLSTVPEGIYENAGNPDITWLVLDGNLLVFQRGRLYNIMKQHDANSLCFKSKRELIFKNS